MEFKESFVAHYFFLQDFFEDLPYVETVETLKPNGRMTPFLRVIIYRISPSVHKILGV